MTATEKKELKIKVLDACIANQQSLIDDFQTRTKFLLEPHGLGNEEAYDNSELAQKARAAEEVNALYEARTMAYEEMKTLFYIRSGHSQLQTSVAPGAIVITDNAVFFVSVSLEQFEADGKHFVAVSTKSPLYLTMKGLSKGSKFQYNEVHHKIIDIF